ncbi:protein Dok-7 [Neolamprologus brichardi]|uniref:protein Dok-7 n=1 Tax=Neolamprologus brichardi TaxID=32507 RepID=UPI0016436C7D|nr:protein Dok-7 [Neolamprologus brichardi]
MQRNNWTNLAEGDDGGGRVSHRLGGLMAQEAGPTTEISFVIYFFPNFFTVEDSVGRSSEALSGRRSISIVKCKLYLWFTLLLQGICGVEPGLGYDGVSYTLSILCLAHMLVLGFNNRDTLLAWDARIRYSLGEVHRFSVNVEPGTKLESGPASLHLCNNLLVLTRGLPPVVVGHWKLSALRRYGAVPNGFVFEGGTRCGYWAGVFFLSCSEGEQISFLFDCIVRGINPSRAPHGLQPDLPADPSADPASAEERINLEASVLEKRLSMLSQCSLASSTASSYSCSTSVAGDDHSSISSSSSSQSDVSYGSRLPVWAEPLGRLHLSSETASKMIAEAFRQCPKNVFPDSPLCIREEQHDSSDISSKLANLKKLLPSLLLHAPPPPPVPPSMHRPTSACGMFRFSHEAPPPASLDCGPCSNSSTNYVNIPVSPLLYKTRELLYTELELQKPSSAPASSPGSAERGNAVQLCRLSKNIAPQTVLDNYLSSPAAAFFFGFIYAK